jgi:hypothetical protein
MTLYRRRCSLFWTKLTAKVMSWDRSCFLLDQVNSFSWWRLDLLRSFRELLGLGGFLLPHDWQSVRSHFFFYHITTFTDQFFIYIDVCISCYMVSVKVFLIVWGYLCLHLRFFIVFVRNVFYNIWIFSVQSLQLSRRLAVLTDTA